MAKSKQKEENKLLLFLKNHVVLVVVSFAILIFLVAIIIVCNKETVVMSVDDHTFNKEDYYMYLYSNKYSLNGDSDITLTKEELSKEYQDGLTLEEYLSKKTVNEMKIAGIVNVMAKENEIELSSKDKKELKEEKDNFIDNLGGNDKYQEVLSNNKTNEKAYDKMAKTDKLYDLLIKKLYSKGKTNDLSNDVKEQAKEEYYDTYYKAKELIISKVDLKTNKLLSTKEINQKRELANSLYNKATDGEDFDTLVNEYSDKESSEIYITKDNIEEDVFNIVKNLEVGEVSNVIEKTNSFYILKRVELDDKKLEEYYNTKRDKELLTDIASYEDKVKIKYSKEFYKLKVF